jgi:PleD family two-component response regulator
MRRRRSTTATAIGAINATRAGTTMIAAGTSITMEARVAIDWVAPRYDRRRLCEFERSRREPGMRMMTRIPDILNASILIVDDREANVRLLEQILTEDGYVRVATTTNSHEVCALHLKNRYDLILLDLQMPGMDGFEVMEGLKEIESEGYLPVIVLTAQSALKNRALRAGAKDFISKPFELVEVTTRIHNMLEVRLLYRQLENYNEVLQQAARERA